MAEAGEEEGQMRCWRCGMILPAAEMQLLDSQWHCSYCLMDVKMLRAEAERVRESHVRERGAGEEGEGHAPDIGGGQEQGRLPATGPGGQMNCEACGRSLGEGAHRTFAGKIVCGSCYVNESRLAYGGYCMKCGREVKRLLNFSGEQLCEECFLEASGSGASGWTTMIRAFVHRVLGVEVKARAVQKKAQAKESASKQPAVMPKSARASFTDAKDAAEKKGRSGKGGKGPAPAEKPKPHK
jgi:hypothetical protein